MEMTREHFYYSLVNVRLYCRLITIYLVRFLELCLGVVVLLFDLAPECGGGLLLHPPDVSHAQLQPRVHSAEHHPATHFLPHTITVRLVICITTYTRIRLKERLIFEDGNTHRARILKLLSCPRIDSKESIPLAYVVAWRSRYDNPIPTRFLAPIDWLEIPAQITQTTQYINKSIPKYPLGVPADTRIGLFHKDKPAFSVLTLFS
jgi:hypothetical protein